MPENEMKQEKKKCEYCKKTLVPIASKRKTEHTITLIGMEESIIKSVISNYNSKKIFIIIIVVFLSNY